MVKELFKNLVASEMTLEEVVANGILQPPIYINAIYSLQEAVYDVERKVQNIKDEKIKN